MPENQGMMEVGGSYAVLGEACRRTRFETWGVVYKMGDDHFQNLCGESVRLPVHHTRARGP